jgi:hypothetical protein
MTEVDDSNVEIDETEVDDIMPVDGEDMEDPTITDDEPLQIETVAVMEKDVQIGEATFELFKDINEEGKEFYYIVLPIDGKMSGFLANLDGDLVDEEGRIMTYLKDLEEMLQDEDFNEFEEAKTGLLIMEIELAEMVPGPDEDLDEAVEACYKSCGRIDGSVHH